MDKDTLDSRQSISLVSSFIIGSSLVFGISIKLKQDSLFGLILSMILVIPVLYMYGKIIKLNPGKTIFDIIDDFFGPFFGKIINILYIWYFFHLGGMVLKNFMEFVSMSMLKTTPPIIIALSLLAVIIYLAKSGMECLGRWSIVVLIIICFVVSFTIFMGFGIIDINNFFPLFIHSPAEYINSSYDIFSFPFAESVVFLGIAPTIGKNNNPIKIYLISSLITFIVFFVVVFRNISFLGIPLNSVSVFPSISSTRTINVADVLTSVEIVIVMNFIFAGITKITVCLISGSKGIAKMIKGARYTDNFISGSLIILTIASIIYKSTNEMIDFVNYYPIYAIPFQVIFPIIIFIISELKFRKQKRLALPQPNNSISNSLVSI